jgi:hypothetical protein
MRIILATLVAAGLAGCSHEPPPAPPPAPVAVVQPPPRPQLLPPEQAPICGKPADKAAFAVAGLKTQLVVLAISCGSNDDYNAFIRRFRTDLLAQEKTLGNYFSRAYGRKASSAQNDYITALANNTSSTGLAAGTEFCQRNAGKFSEVMALKSSKDLADYAMAQDIDQPLAVPDCDAPKTASAKP